MSRVSRPRSPARIRPWSAAPPPLWRSARAVGALVAGAIIAVALPAAPAGADVLVLPEPSFGGPQPPVIATFAPAGGPTRQVGPLPVERESPDVRPVPSPDRRTLALHLGKGIALFDLAGAPTRTLRVAVDRRLQVDDPLGPLWWSPDGTVVRRAGLRVTEGRRVVLRCVVATGACSTGTVPLGLEVSGALADGRSLATRTIPAGVERRLLPSEGNGAWRPTTSAALRRDRRILRTPVPDELVLLSPNGRRERTLERSRRSASSGLTLTGRPVVGATGALVTWTRVRTVVESRRRGGRLESRSSAEVIRSGVWRITPEGRRVTFRAGTPGGVAVEDVVAGAGPRGWLLTTVAPRRDPVAAFAAADGTLSPVTLAGRPLTAESLVAAVRPGEPGDQPSIYPAGYEVGADAVVVFLRRAPIEGEGGTDVVRVPQAAGAPTTLRSFPFPEFPSATAW